MKQFAKCSPHLAALAQTLQLRFPFFLDSRDMFAMVEDFIEVHQLRKSRGMDVDIVSLLRRAAQYPEHAVLHKPFFQSIDLDRELLRTQYPNLRHVEMLHWAEPRHELATGSQIRLGGQSFAFNESYYKGHLRPFIVESIWMNSVCLASPENITSFKFEGLCLSAEFARNLEMLTHVKRLDLSFVETADGPRESPLFCRCCVSEWFDQLTAMSGLADLRLAFQGGWESISEAILDERYFPYLEDILPPVSNLRKLSVANWPIRLAHYCQVTQELRSDQELELQGLLVDVKGTELELEDLLPAMVLSKVMSGKYITLESVHMYCLNYDRGRGPLRAIGGYAFNLEDINEAISEVEDLFRNTQETGNWDRLTDIRAKAMISASESGDNTYDRLVTEVKAAAATY
ncbi:MAG: hypothetical protein Q9219_001944 [cf. Caloplaca sp. 3 TL-2023]